MIAVGHIVVSCMAPSTVSMRIGHQLRDFDPISLGEIPTLRSAVGGMGDKVRVVGVGVGVDVVMSGRGDVWLARAAIEMHLQLQRP
jgi:hypothetical protein